MLAVIAICCPKPGVELEVERRAEVEIFDAAKERVGELLGLKFVSPGKDALMR